MDQQEKWLVETLSDQFTKATGSLEVHRSGALVFRPSIWSAPTLVMAPGTWLSVVQDED